MKKLVTLLFIVITNILFGQDSILIKKFDKLESLVDKQTSLTKDLRQEEKKLVERIDKLTEVYDSVSRQNIVKNEEFKNQISSNTKDIDLINNKKPDKKQNSLTDWLKAMAVIGTILSIYNFYSQKIKRLNDLEEYFKVIVEALNEPLKKQSNWLLKSANQLKKREFKNPKFKFNSDLEINNVNNINHSDLYKIFVSNRRGDSNIKISEFHRLRQALKFIDKIIPELQNTANEFKTTYNEKGQSLGKYYLKLINYHHKYKNKNQLMVKFGQLVDDLNVKLKQAKDKNAPDYQNHYLILDTLIEPLFEYCKKNNIQMDSKLNSILTSHKTECLSFDNIRNSYSEYANKRSIKLENIRNQLKDSLNNLSKIKKVYKWLLLFS